MHNSYFSTFVSILFPISPLTPRWSPFNSPSVGCDGVSNCMYFLSGVTGLGVILELVVSWACRHTPFGLGPPYPQLPETSLSPAPSRMPPVTMASPARQEIRGSMGRMPTMIYTTLGWKFERVLSRVSTREKRLCPHCLEGMERGGKRDVRGKRKTEMIKAWSCCFLYSFSRLFLMLVCHSFCASRVKEKEKYGFSSLHKPGGTSSTPSYVSSVWVLLF